MRILEKSPIVLVLLLAVLCSGFNGVRVGPFFNLSDAILVILALAWAVTFPLRKHVELRAPIAISGLLFLVSFFITSAGGLTDSGANADLAVLLKVMATFFFLPYLISDMTNTPQRVRLILLAYVGSAVINAMVALTDYLGVSDFQTWLDLTTVGGFSFGRRVHGLTTHPNHLAQQCAIAVFMAVGLLPPARHWIRRFVWAATVILLLAVIMASGSRGALLAVMAVGSIVLIAYHRRIAFRLRRIVGIAAILLVVLSLTNYLSSSADLQSALVRLLGGGAGVDLSDEARLLGYKIALNDFSSSPIVGVGFAHVGGVENVYLQFLQGGGLIGFFGLLLYLVPSVYLGLKNCRRYPTSLQSLGVICAVGVFLLTSLTQNLVYARFTLIPMGVLWALLHLQSSWGCVAASRKPEMSVRWLGIDQRSRWVGH